jgi:hypothetical protein
MRPKTHHIGTSLLMHLGKGKQLSRKYYRKNIVTPFLQHFKTGHGVCDIMCEEMSSILIYFLGISLFLFNITYY